MGIHSVRSVARVQPSIALPWTISTGNALQGAARVCAQIALLWAVSAASSLVSTKLHLPVPGNVLGLVALVGALATGIVKIEWFDVGGALLTKHLAFFFVPITVGLMGFGAIFAQYGFAIIVTLVVSAVLGLLAAGMLTQTIAARLPK